MDMELIKNFIARFKKKKKTTLKCHLDITIKREFDKLAQGKLL